MANGDNNQTLPLREGRNLRSKFRGGVTLRPPATSPLPEIVFALVARIQFRPSLKGRVERFGETAIPTFIAIRYSPFSSPSRRRSKRRARLPTDSRNRIRGTPAPTAPADRRLASVRRRTAARRNR